MRSDAGSIRWGRMALLALPVLLFIAGCGGSGSIVAGGGTGGTGISAGVITDFGSVIVNDVEFDLSGTVITVNDNTASEGDLRLGMFVKIRGTFLSDGTTGVANLLDAENEVLGAISSLGPDSFTVLGQMISVDNQTFLSSVNFNGLQLGDIVEVYGVRDGFDIVRATRVEKKSSGEGQFSVKGTVSHFTGGNTFNIGALLVTSTVPLPAGFGNGVFVDVKGDPTGPESITATTIVLEDEEDAPFNPQEGEKVEVEGFVTGFTAHPGDFMVGKRIVRTTASTRFEHGTSGDLTDDVRVEAEGRIDANGILVAEKIEFE